MENKSVDTFLENFKWLHSTENWVNLTLENINFLGANQTDVASPSQRPTISRRIRGLIQDLDHMPARRRVVVGFSPRQPVFEHMPKNIRCVVMSPDVKL